MAFKSLREDRFLAPPNSSDSDLESANPDVRKRRKRNANLYDAVAGRVTTTLPLDQGSDDDVTHSHHQRPVIGDSLRDPTLAPDEVLFSRAGAPIRFAEKDIYHAADRLPHYGRDTLPDSDMLQAIHTYASQYYTSLALRQQDQNGGKGKSRTTVHSIDDRSMDETALLAFGILLEEAGREVLGATGDLVLTEGQEIQNQGRQDTPAGPSRPTEPKGTQQQQNAEEEGQLVGFADSATILQQRRKRRSARSRSRGW